MYGDDNLLKDNGGKYQGLKKKIDIAVGNGLANSSIVDTLKANTKLLSDLAAHSFTVKVREDDFRTANNVLRIKTVTEKNGKNFYKSPKYEYRLLEPIGLGTLAILLDRISDPRMPFNSRVNRRKLMVIELVKVAPFITWERKTLENYSNQRPFIIDHGEHVYAVWEDYAAEDPDSEYLQQALNNLTMIERERKLI